MRGWALGRVLVWAFTLGALGLGFIGLLGVDGVVGLLVLALVCFTIGWIIGKIWH